MAHLSGRSVVLAAAMAIVAASGCSSSNSPGTHPASSGPTATAGTVPDSVPNNPDKRNGVSLIGCAAVSGGWEASGAAMNPTSTATKYLITVFFTTSQATDQTYASTTVDVAAGKSTTWRVSAHFTADPSTVCVLRGVA